MGSFPSRTLARRSRVDRHPAGDFRPLSDRRHQPAKSLPPCWPPAIRQGNHSKSSCQTYRLGQRRCANSCRHRNKFRTRPTHRQTCRHHFRCPPRWPRRSARNRRAHPFNNRRGRNHNRSEICARLDRPTANPVPHHLKRTSPPSRRQRRPRKPLYRSALGQ